MGELLFEFGELFLAGADFAAAREQAGRRLSRADDERAVRGQQLAVAGDEREPAAGGLREPQRRGEPIDKPAAAEQPFDERDELGRGFDKAIGPAHHARLLAEIGTRRRLAAPRQIVEAQESDAAGDAERLFVEPIEQPPRRGDDDELRELAQRDVDQRRRVDVDVEQIGDDAADFAVRAVRFALGGKQHFADARVEAFEPLVELGEHVDPFAGPRELAFELAMLLVDANHFAPQRGEPAFAGLELGLAGVDLRLGGRFLPLELREIGRPAPIVVRASSSSRRRHFSRSVRAETSCDSSTVTWLASCAAERAASRCFGPLIVERRAQLR